MTAFQTTTRPATVGSGGADPRSEHRLGLVVAISRAIGTIRDRRALMTAIMKHVTQAFGAERSSLFLHDRDRGELWTLVAQGLDGQQAELRLPDDHGICGRVFQTHESACVADADGNPHFARWLAHEIGYLPQSMLVVPLVNASHRCDGVLQVMDRRPALFREDDLPLLEAIAVQVGICLENTRLHEAQKRQFNSFVRALSAALDARDPLTAIHSVNVANYAMGIGQVMELPPRDVEQLRIAGLVHDIGKIGVPEALLTKPGRLTPDEYAEMKRHAEHSRRILSQIEFTDELIGVDAIAAAHHERLDGAGYPDGLAGEQIPLMARIIAVADVYDALTQTRHYRRSMTTDEAFAVIAEMTPAALDAACAGALKAFLGRGHWPMAGRRLPRLDGPINASPWRS